MSPSSILTSANQLIVFPALRMSKDFTQGFTTRTTSGLLPAICMLGGCAVYHLPTSVCEAGNMAAKKKKEREECI